MGKPPDKAKSASTSSAARLDISAPADDSETLRRLIAGTVHATGERFFQLLVMHLSLAVDARYAFVAEFAGGGRGRVRTIALWRHDQIVDNMEWDLDGTPCEDVIRGRLCHHPRGVAQTFPRDEMLAQLGIESYLGVPLLAPDGATLGHLAVLDERPMPEEPRRLQVFQIFATRAAAELDRLRILRRLHEAEARYRDLFEEAPIPYVYEDTETRFISANRAFMQLLGLAPEDVPGTYGLSLVAPAAETQKRVHASLSAEQAGHERDVIEIELRRKDNGRPVWVQRWSRPEPDGKHTRTMIIDITARVLAEAEKSRLQQQNRYLREEIQADHNFEEIIGRSPALAAALALVRQVATTDASVLITGETGTGKELIARAIHDTSRRKDRPFIKLNCAALPTGLIESELFGHEKGAFTGAIEKRVGRFALADGGTIFLDEIGDMPLDVQVRLLRVLQEREFEPVGSPRTVKVDVRVIAATNRDLERAVTDGSFRSDLLYRINVFPIPLPPLRDRREDIPLLTHYFLNRFASRIGKRIDSVASDTMRRLVDYSWPGNIRELANVLERAVILTTGESLEVDSQTLRAHAAPDARDSGRVPTDSSPPASTGDGTIAEHERRHILAALARTNWIIDGPNGAARILGLHPNTLRSRMKKLGVERSHGRS